MKVNYKLCQGVKLFLINLLAYTAVRETAGLARSVNTQRAVRQPGSLGRLIHRGL
jgi:hypothetical protein